MPLTVFDTKGVPLHRRERIETAVEFGGKDVAAPYEAWIAADPFRGGVRVLITGPQGFERTVSICRGRLAPGDHAPNQRDTGKLKRRLTHRHGMAIASKTIGSYLSLSAITGSRLVRCTRSRRLRLLLNGITSP
jgi:hypothetical protein